MNKLRSTIIILGLIVFGCTNNMEESIQSKINDDLKEFSDKSQFFTITNDSQAVIKGNLNSMIKIESNSFVKKDGSPPKTDIIIELKEIYSKSQMIFNGLSTTSDNRLLESGGMVFINAMAEQDTLILRKNISITLPNRFNLNDGKYFKGEFKEQTINWTLDMVELDTIMTIKRVVTLSYGPDAIAFQRIRIKGQDTIALNDGGNLTSDWQSDTSSIPEPPIPSEFLFDLNKLGWINCDEFYEISESTNLKLMYEGNKNLTGFLIFNNLSSVIGIPFLNGHAEIEPLPLNEPVTIIVMSKSNDEYWFFKKEINPGAVEELTIDLKTESLSNISKEIKNLDK